LCHALPRVAGLAAEGGRSRRRPPFLQRFEPAAKAPWLPPRPLKSVKDDIPMRHIIALLIENEPGALSRVVALFSARGYNIESLTVAPTEDASLSRMTIVTTGSDEIIEQITKHLNRLIEVVKVVDLTEGNYTERELMLIKVRAVGKEREEVKRTADIFRGRIIDVTEKTYTIELTGDAGKLDAFIDAIDRTSILETVRTGASGIGRGERILRV
jgi:acetolactate synthase I/III small subunit